MNKKTYRYYVSYTAMSNSIGLFGGTILVYDEPLDTQDMLLRATKDIESMNNLTNVVILNWKRIKDNRQ